jgi:hypothetical protein
MNRDQQQEENAFVRYARRYRNARELALETGFRERYHDETIEAYERAVLEHIDARRKMTLT